MNTPFLIYFRSALFSLLIPEIRIRLIPSTPVLDKRRPRDVALERLQPERVAALALKMPVIAVLDLARDDVPREGAAHVRPQRQVPPYEEDVEQQGHQDLHQEGQQHADGSERERARLAGLAVHELAKDDGGCDFKEGVSAWEA